MLSLKNVFQADAYLSKSVFESLFLIASFAMLKNPKLWRYRVSICPILGQELHLIGQRDNQWIREMFFVVLYLSKRLEL